SAELYRSFEIKCRPTCLTICKASLGPSSPSKIKYTTLLASPICFNKLLMCSWIKRSDGLSSTSRRLRFLLPGGRPRCPLDFFVGWACTTSSTCKVRGGIHYQ